MTRRGILMIAMLAAGGLPARADLDLDGDGMSDVWQRHHGIASGDVTGDADHDGQSNEVEARAGTDPDNAGDRFQISGGSLNAAGTAMTIRWRGIAGRSYTIMQTTGQGTAAAVATVLGTALASETETTIAVAAGSESRFWRVRIDATPALDTDADGLANWEEAILGTNPGSGDGDGDRMPDAWEFSNLLDPLANDAGGNPDGDGLTNFQEYLAGLHPRTADPPVTYASQSRTLVHGADTRTYVLSRPSSQGGKRLPLVIGLHGDGGNASGFRDSLNLEARMNGGAIAAYVKSKSGSFEYWTVAGRDYEAAFLTSLINTLVAEGLARADRVFLTGHSGGAVMCNAVAARLKTPVIRGSGIMAGSIYSISNDIPITSSGVAGLPPAIIIWGQNDTSGGTEYAGAGLNTRNVYLNTFQCSSTTVPGSPSPTVIYPSTISPIYWSAIPGMGHSMWSGAGEAVWTYFVSRL